MPIGLGTTMGKRSDQVRYLRKSQCNLPSSRKRLTQPILRLGVMGNDVSCRLPGQAADIVHER